jgi:hypothetical protein
VRTLPCVRTRFFIIEYKPQHLAFATPHADPANREAMYLIDADTGEVSDTIPRQPGEDEIATLRRRFPRQRGFKPRIGESTLGGSEFYPRMWRPGMPLHRAVAWQPWAASVEAARALFDGMRRVFRVVEPTTENAHVYGHEIRQLLILACTEVESAWKAILRANGYAPTSKGKPRDEKHWKTTDYVKLLGPMRLAEWSVEFYSHAEYRSIRPFARWKDANATESLSWYRAYNAVKHNRESHFSDATMAHMIDAMAAVFIMIKAQFGTFSFDGDRSEREEFRVSSMPKWLPEDCYVPYTANYGSHPQEVPYPF